MHTNDNPKLPEELASDPGIIEALKALKGLYPKSTSETREEELRHYYYLYEYIYNVNNRLTILRWDLEKIQKDRTFMEKTEGPVQ